jgi:hypothetical protein
MIRDRSRTRTGPLVRAVCLACAVAAVCSGGCHKKKVVMIHLETSSGSLFYWDRGVITFDPEEGTSFRKDGEGDWADGAVTYGVNEDGAFEIVMDGEWMQEQALANRERFGNTYVVEVPLTNVEAKGTFDVRAVYRYNDVEDGTGWRTTHEGLLYSPVTLPLDGSGSQRISLLMQCVDEQWEACTPVGMDPDPVETPDVADVAEGEDATDATTDPDAADAWPDTGGDPVVTDTAGDLGDAGGDPPFDPAAEEVDAAGDPGGDAEDAADGE